MEREKDVARRPGAAGAAARRVGLAEAAGGPARPEQVPGPDGCPLTLQSLPSPDIRRWVVRRKAEVLAAIRGGLLSEAEACARYRLSPEELELWRESLARDGIPGLRVTRIQLYRDYPLQQSVRPRRAAPSPRGLAARDLAGEWGG